MVLKELLKDWTDFDIAEYYLACSLGIVKYNETFDELKEQKAFMRQEIRLEIRFLKCLKRL